MIKHFIKKTHAAIQHISNRVSSFAKKQKEVVPHKKLSMKVVHASNIPNKTEFFISNGTMARFVAITILLLASTFFVYQIRDIIILFFVALLFAAALDPMVDALERKRIPRSVGVLIIYLAVFLFLGLLMANLVPIVASELGRLATHIQVFVTNFVKGDLPLPSWLEWSRPDIQNFLSGLDISSLAGYKDILLNAANRLSDLAGNVLNGVFGVFNGVFNAIIVLVLTFMMTIDENAIDNFILSMFSARHATYISDKTRLIKEKMGYWLRGQIVLCIIVGVCVYIGFLIVGLFTKNIEYAATIALVAGCTELIPYAGPLIAWIIALPIVANQSFSLVIWMTVIMYIVQTLENNFIVPVVFHKAVGISPILIMFAMFVGYEFLGILGMVLSVPVATMFAIFLKDYSLKEK